MAKYKVVMSSTDYVELLYHIAKDLKTGYMNKFPYNLGYRHQTNIYTWDCWDLPKSIIWGWKEGGKFGSYAKMDKSTGLGDWTGGTIMNHCREKSTNFSKITPGEFMMNPGNTHAGTYIGTVKIDGKTYNVVECTTAFGRGVVFSYVSSSGYRYSYKGGKRNGSWAKHGKLPWIDYTVKENKTDVEVKIFEYKQPTMKDPQVGTIQALLNAKNKTKLAVDNSYGPATLKAVKAFQKKKGLAVTGKTDKETWEALIN